MIGETYNIGGENQPTNLELAEQLCSLLDDRLSESPHRPHASLIKSIADRPGHDQRYAMDIRKIQSELGWSPTESLETGIKKTIEWYLEHSTWLENLQKRPSLQKWLLTNYDQRETPV
jgi:dTDP-glucose 4,6-dehydratase